MASDRLETAPPLIEVRDLVKHFPVKSGLLGGLSGAQDAVRAVNGVSFTVRQGEVLGLAGESGCGKTTTAKLLLRLIAPTSGTIRIAGQERYVAIEDAGRLRDSLGTALPVGVPEVFTEPVADPLGDLTGLQLCLDAVRLYSD